MAIKDYLGFGAINSFLSPEKGYDEARKEQERAWREAQGYTQPYLDAGNGQLPRLTGAEDELMNPGGLYNKWAADYETSPYAQQLLQENQSQGLDAASSMGLNGSSAAIGNIQQGAGNIVQRDRESFMNDLMNKYLAGIGIGKNIYDTGANTASEMARARMGLGRDQAGLKYGAMAAPGDLYGRMLGTAAGIFGNKFGGGNQGAYTG